MKKLFAITLLIISCGASQNEPSDNYLSSEEYSHPVNEPLPETDRSKVLDDCTDIIAHCKTNCETNTPCCDSFDACMEKLVK
jgi:hypothetical protein